MGEHGDRTADRAQVGDHLVGTRPDLRNRLSIGDAIAPERPLGLLAIRRFDPATGLTSPAGQLPRPLTDAAVATIGRTVYLLGGISSGPLATVVKVQPR